MFGYAKWEIGIQKCDGKIGTAWKKKTRKPGVKETRLGWVLTKILLQKNAIETNFQIFIFRLQISKKPDYLGSNKVNRVLHVNYENYRLAEMKHIQSWFRNFRFFHELVLIHSIFLLKLSVVSL